MSSKRVAYKPAVQKEVGSRERRKPLAQGRLVTHQSQTSKNTKTLPQGQDPQPKERALVNRPESLGQSARQNLSSLLKSDVSLNGNHSLNPRKNTPHVSQAHSPGKTEPSLSLDLSDTESDLLRERHHAGRSEVLVIDASNHTHGPDDSEIDIQMGFVMSPAKVICHARAAPNPIDSANSSGTKTVEVEHVPSIIMSPRNEREDGVGSATEPSVIRTTPLNTSAGKAEANPAKPEVVKMLFSRSMDNRHTEESNDLKQKQKMQKSNSEISLDSVDSLSDISEMSGVQKTKKTVPPKTKHVVLSTSDIKKKKKSTRVVQSRFMQSTAKPGPMKATDRSIISRNTSSVSAPKRNVSHSNVSVLKARTPSKKKNVKAVRNTSQSSFSTTPEVKGQGGKVSTPTVEGSMFVAPGVDVSAIASSAMGNSLPHLDNTPSSVNAADSRYGQLAAQGQHGVSPYVVGTPTYRDHHDGDSFSRTNADNTENMGKKNVTPQITQKRLDLLYARYVQWVFLESKARKAFQDQEKQAMLQMYALWEENEKLERRSHELDLEIARVKHLQMLDETLDTQATGLESMTSTVPQFKKQFDLLSQALDATRHQMLVKGVMIPTEQEEYTNALLRVLAESEQLLGEIDCMVRPAAPKISSFAQSWHQMEESLGSELQEMAKCKELLAAAQVLTTQLNSLQIQDILNCEL